LVPYLRQWLRSLPERPRVLVEPFAGGAIIGLTAAAEGLADRVVLVELDEDVASVWETIIYGDADWLVNQILTIELTHERIGEIVGRRGMGTKERALATVVENRINRGGILAPGAGRVKNGENGRGLLSRWYPETLCRRIRDIVAIRERLEFVHGDGLEALERRLGEASFAFFVDPPYTVAGRRLYKHSEMDHRRLLSLAGQLAGDSLITYDDSQEIVRLALGEGLQVCWVPMKTTHHEQKLELLIGRSLAWLNPAAPACEPSAEAALRTLSG